MGARGLLGVGAAVPAQVRTNDDPIFDVIRSTSMPGGAREQDCFSGVESRRIVGPEDALEDLMVLSARAALEDAGLIPQDIDRLYGNGSVSEFVTPNVLYRVHARLGLRPEVWVVPLHLDHSTFGAGIVAACEGIAAGHCRRALVACGSNWSRHVDYSRPNSAIVGDGAGAAVVGEEAVWQLVGVATETLSDQYGTLTVSHAYTHGAGAGPLFNISPAQGMTVLETTGLDYAGHFVSRFLHAHGLSGKDVCLISHQHGRRFLSRYAELIEPREHFDTLRSLGNMTSASVPVTLARYYHSITTEYLVLLHLGLGNHLMAVLFRHSSRG